MSHPQQFKTYAEIEDWLAQEHQKITSSALRENAAIFRQTTLVLVLMAIAALAVARIDSGSTPLPPPPTEETTR